MNYVGWLAKQRIVASFGTVKMELRAGRFTSPATSKRYDITSFIFHIWRTVVAEVSDYIHQTELRCHHYWRGTKLIAKERPQNVCLCIAMPNEPPYWSPSVKKDRIPENNCLPTRAFESKCLTGFLTECPKSNFSGTGLGNSKKHRYRKTNTIHANSVEQGARINKQSRSTMTKFQRLRLHE